MDTKTNLVYMGRRLNRSADICHMYAICDIDVEVVSKTKLKAEHIGYRIGAVLESDVEYNDNGVAIGASNTRVVDYHRNQEDVASWQLADRATYAAWSEYQAIDKALNGKPLDYQIDLLRNAYHKCPANLRSSLLGYIIRKITS